MVGSDGSDGRDALTREVKGPERVRRPATPPSIALPKAGGAIRGIDEKVAANPVTGTATETVPIATSPGRDGFGPRLALTYDSGAGQGPFGLGWALRLPHITRKTDKGLPRYLDADESDVFQLAESDDLVPETAAGGTLVTDTTTAPGYAIRRYRPRIEGLFARIERWTRIDGDIHWRAIGGDNVLTIYGKDARSRICDPLDARRVFTWLVCEQRDDKGNATVYDYKAEDAAGVDLGAAHEAQRGPLADPRRMTNRYLARIRYGNRVPQLDDAGARPQFLDDAALAAADWAFEVALDYGEYDATAPTPHDAGTWASRLDPWSSYRAGFEVRTRRLCRRVLMFHHFPDAAAVGADCLVASTDLAYVDSAAITTLSSITHTGYVRSGSTYEARSLPPVAYEYTQPIVQAAVDEVAPESLENLPAGFASGYRWADLHGEGTPGVLAEQGGAWFYTRNITPLSGTTVVLEATATVALRPTAAFADGAQLADLSGAGVPDFVSFDGPTPGFYQHDDAEGWLPFRALASRANRNTQGRDTRLVDLDGDGRADLLVTDQDCVRWCPSLGEAGFGPELRVALPRDEAAGARVVLSDGTDTIYLADMSGDGLQDLVRVRNGEVCYWPNLGYGQFGARVRMDASPRFDTDDAFDPRRIRIADIDGSGAADLIYLHATGPRIYFNQAGNAWGDARPLASFPRIDDIGSVETADLFGNGTMCLVWSSPLPGASRRVRYVDLMGGQKPHLLVRRTNGLGAETRVDYTTSTKFFLADRYAGQPWVTKLPFPVQVVERVTTLDATSGNRFTTRYAYRDGYYDGVEREFRGFGRVDQWDTEELATLAGGTPATNVDDASNVPPALTRTWFHLGIRAPGAAVPPGLSADDEREACRAFKGSMLRQEVYALDGTARAAQPYTVTEQTFAVELVQLASAASHYGVYFTHARETITTHVERDTADPRVQHTLVLETDAFGNPRRELAIAYGRTQPSTDPALSDADRAAQARTLVTYTEHDLTTALATPADVRNPLPAETRSYELTGFAPAQPPRFTFDEWTRNSFALVASAGEIAFEVAPTAGVPQKRLVARTRTLYRRDDLTALSPLGVVEPHAITGEQYELALTPGLVALALPKLATPAAVIESTASDGGGYVALERVWWIPSGRFYFGDATLTVAQELAQARAHFFLARRFVDPFAHATAVDYDSADLFVARTVDALGNTATAEHDYRVLQPALVTDANGNRQAAAFDALGHVIATARMGKVGETLGDLLDGVDADPPIATIQAFVADPAGAAAALLGKATTRLVYDIGRFTRTGQPPFAATLTRETHWADAGGPTSRIQIAFVYSDGFARVVQRKLQAEPGDAPTRGAAHALPGGDLAPGALALDAQGHPVLAPTSTRWVGSGRTVYNNKGKSVRAYEPFFSSTHLYEPERDLTDTGPSSVTFYDPLGRVVAKLHPEQTYDKTVFGAWGQTAYDVNDTVAMDPHADPDIRGTVAGFLAATPWTTWFAQRSGGQLGAAELAAATQATVHADTPATSYTDPLGREIAVVAHNRYVRGGVTIEELQVVRTARDIVGNEIAIGDPLGRRAMQYVHDLAKRPLVKASMEAGERHILPAIGGDPIRTWDSRGFVRRMAYDELRRPTDLFVTDATERLAERTIYGEAQGSAANHRTRVYQRLDDAGVETTAAYDFEGNVTQLVRDLLPGFGTPVDWNLSPAVTGGSYAVQTAYDALARIVQQTTPDLSVHRPRFDVQNRLQSVTVNLRGAATATSFVSQIDYDAKGQRLAVAYGNGAASTYAYDPLTLRLIGLATERPATPDATASQLFVGTAVQNLAYTYDPVGNVVRIADSALRTIFYNGQQIEPTATFTYDAVYRLIEATGREHVAQCALDPAPASSNFRDLPFVGLAHPNDLQAIQVYTERYEYDLAGNPTSLRHIVAGGGWVRTYDYEETSQLEPAMTSNRITRTTIGAGVEPLAYDAHGNITSLPPVAGLDWDFHDRLSHAGLGGGGDAYYAYDSAGHRVRKLIAQGTVARKLRVYVGAYELYRELAANGAVTLARETLHVLDDKRRIALVETEAGGTPAVRYQLASHLGSATVELDGDGALIGYEEYHPYGTSALQAGRSVAEASLKRYRYSGKERDEETGLCYHHQRYLAPQLARWTSCDPAGFVDGPNLYAYARGNPLRYADPHGTDPTTTDPATYQPPAPPQPAPHTGTPLSTGEPTVPPAPDPNVKEPVGTTELKDIVKDFLAADRKLGQPVPPYLLPAGIYDYSTNPNGQPDPTNAVKLLATMFLKDPKLSADLSAVLKQPQVATLAGFAAGSAAAAAAGGQWGLASLLVGLVPPDKSLFTLRSNSVGLGPSSGSSKVTGFSLSTASSTAIAPPGQPEAANALGAALRANLYLRIGPVPVSLSYGFNARLQPLTWQVRTQEQIGVDARLLDTRLGTERVRLDAYFRHDEYQRIDLTRQPTPNTRIAPEVSGGVRLTIGLPLP